MNLCKSHKSPQQGLIQQETDTAGQNKKGEFIDNSIITACQEHPMDTQQVAHHNTDTNTDQIRPEVVDASKFSQAKQYEKVYQEGQASRTEVAGKFRSTGVVDDVA